MVYYFSGGFTDKMVQYLQNMPGFEPVDVLVTQLDRNSINAMLRHIKSGVVNKLFIDSGAFSVHTGKATVDIDEYISYVNSIDEHVAAIAQVDTIPGTFGMPKSKKDYEESARKSWENFLYMYKRVKSPEKLIPVFHYGESFDVLRAMLAWRDEQGKPLTYLGISPANDTSQKVKNVYMRNVYDIIAKSSNPSVRTHLFGMTALDALSKFPCYSADSISHRLVGAYGKVLIPEFGVISVSKRSRTSKTKSNMSFLDTADELAMSRLEKYLSSLNVTVDEIADIPDARVAVTMYSIIHILKANPYRPTNTKSSIKLFELPEVKYADALSADLSPLALMDEEEREGFKRYQEAKKKYGDAQ